MAGDYRGSGPRVNAYIGARIACILSILFRSNEREESR